jgi:hypothetical protein
MLDWRVTGARPAQAASLLPLAKAGPSPISARMLAPVRGPIPGRLASSSLKGCDKNASSISAARGVDGHGQRRFDRLPPRRWDGNGSGAHLNPSRKCAGASLDRQGCGSSLEMAGQSSSGRSIPVVSLLRWNRRAAMSTRTPRIRCGLARDAGRARDTVGRLPSLARPVTPGLRRAESGWPIRFGALLGRRRWCCCMRWAKTGPTGEPWRLHLPATGGCRGD